MINDYRQTDDIRRQLDAMTDGLDEWCHERSTRRRTVMLNTAIVVAALVVIIGILHIPRPDGFYTSDYSHRVAAISSADEILLCAKL